MNYWLASKKSLDLDLSSVKCLNELNKFIISSLPQILPPASEQKCALFISANKIKRILDHSFPIGYSIFAALPESAKWIQRQIHTYCETAEHEGIKYFSKLQCSDAKLIWVGDVQ